MFLLQGLRNLQHVRLPALDGQSVLAGYVHRHEYVPFMPLDLPQWQRVEYTAIHEQSSLPLHGLEEQRDRDGGTNRLEQGTFTEHDLIRSEQIGGNERQRHG